MEKSVEPADPPDQPTTSNIEADHHNPSKHSALRTTSVDRCNWQSLKLLADDVDAFVNSLSPSPEIPDTVQVYVKMVQAELDKYESSSSAVKITANPDRDSVLVDSVSRIGKLANFLCELPSETVAPWLSLTTAVLHQATAFMEDELRSFLVEFAKSAPSAAAPSASPTKIPKPRSFLHRRGESSDSSIQHHHSNNSFTLEPEMYIINEDDDYPSIPDQMIECMRDIVTVMVSIGYETECCQVYNQMRRKAFKSAMKKRGFQKLSIDEVAKMNWDQLETYIVTWNKVVRHTTKIMFPREYHLCNQVFSAFPSIVEGIMTNLAKAIITLFLTFAEAMTITKREAERLFRVLEIYESLMDLMSTMESSMQSKKTANELKSEILSVTQRLGEAAVGMFVDVESFVQMDSQKNAVPGGGVHSLTRYIINYLRCACEFRRSLEQMPFVVDDQQKSSGKRSPFAAEVLKILNLLDANLDAKSKQYKDPSLRLIFQMNNGRYILQMIKESPAMHEVVGSAASRKRSTELRSCHKSYQRESWSKVLQCLNHDGLQVNGKVHKPILKERFKTFNQMFEDIHKTQSGWVVNDEQLQSELRVSISSVMIPAYRNFVARFGQYFMPGRQVEKYIKYQPEDIEATVEELFDGNPSSSSSSKIKIPK